MIIHFVDDEYNETLIDVQLIEFKKDPIVGEYYKIIEKGNKQWHYIASDIKAIDSLTSANGPVILAKAKSRKI